MKVVSVKYLAMMTTACLLVVMSGSESHAQRHRDRHHDHDDHHHHGHHHHGHHHARYHGGFSLRISSFPYSYYGTGRNLYYGYRTPGCYSYPYYGPVYRSYGTYYGRQRHGGIYIGW
ncbi:MAG: hypothetical protein MK108_01415 [Mariniblastus sp.]|nr:hypothetical protein [Mariniblastus sp.]